eukprot:m.185532 g.185532  ORF g.185532 m.185532 type:complete len:447 (-) comp25565_c0_seq1:220-1560(-)
MFALPVFVLVCVALAKAAPSADEIQALPGWSAALPSKQYSGYVKATGSRQLHYWLVESENNPATDPVVLWLNGGPGCSSLDGYMYEHGPFHVNESNHEQLYYNDYTWAKVANVLYLEAPAGVGFSYSDNPSEYRTNDTSTAEANLAALESFFKLFPEYAQNEFYITGESYAGIYVPTLADQIRMATAAGTTKINLRGIAVGNGCTGNSVGVCGGDPSILPEYLFAHALYSPPTHDKIVQECGNYKRPLSAACDLALAQASKEVGRVDIYDIYGDCISGSEDMKAPRKPLRAPVSRVGGPDECIDSIAASAYLNRPDVQAAIHVKPAPSGHWSVCGNVISYTSTEPDLPKTTYPGLIKEYFVTIFNGDADACVPYTDNEEWTMGMGYDVAEPWRPWMVDQQVAGYVTQYAANNFTFLTVKGAGHMVPQYKPVQALEFFKRFLAGGPY